MIEAGKPLEQQMRFINIDWLAVSGRCHRKDDVFYIPVTRERGSEIIRKTMRKDIHLQATLNIDGCSTFVDIKAKLRDKGSPQYKYIYDIFLCDCKVAELQLEPFSTIIPADSCILRIVNRYLYSYFDMIDNRLDYAELIHVICMVFGIDNLKYSRLDVCCDMFYTDNNGQSFQRFLRQYAATKLRKMSRAKGAFFFDSSKAGNVYYCLNLGAKLSDITLKIYNKTKEMEEEQRKPYIYDAWERYIGHYPEQDIWRIELSFRDSAFNRVNCETGEMHMCVEDIRATGLALFTYYAAKWCDFRYPCSDTNVTRWRRYTLIDTAKVWKRAELVRCYKYVSNSSDKQLIRKLCKVADEYANDQTAYIQQYVDCLVSFLIEENGLQQWYIAHRSGMVGEHKDVPSPLLLNKWQRVEAVG